MAKFKDIVIPVSKKEQWTLDHMIPAYLYQIDAMSGNLRSSFQEYIDIYTGYRDVLNFHSPIMTRWSKDPKNITGSFKISIGSAVLKGARRYRLPNMSLLLYCGDVSPYIVTDVKHELRHYNYDHLVTMARKLHALKQGDPWNLTKVEQGHISSHPHVSSDNTPCLGYFSEAMMTTVATGNLPTLKEVAFSFISNWTRNDAYWDINDTYRNWDSLRMCDTFNDYLMIMHTLDQVFRINPNENGHYYQTDFINSETEKLLELGWSRTDVYVFSRLFHNLRTPEKDTTDGKLKYCLDIVRKIRREFTDKMRTCSTGTSILKNLNVGPLTDRAIINNSAQCNVTHTPMTEDIANFELSYQANESVSRTISLLDNIYNRPYRNSVDRRKMYSVEALTTVKRMLFRERFRTINDNITSDEVFKKMATDLCQHSSTTSSMTRVNGWLFVLRSMAMFAQYQTDLDEVGCDSEEFNELFDVEQQLKYWKQLRIYAERGIEGLHHLQQIDMLERMFIRAGKQVYKMLMAIGPLATTPAFQQRWRHFISAKVKDNVIKQLRNNIRSLENERNNNIHRCNENGQGVQTFDSYDDGSENQISIAAF